MIAVGDERSFNSPRPESRAEPAHPTGSLVLLHRYCKWLTSDVQNPFWMPYLCDQPEARLVRNSEIH